MTSLGVGFEYTDQKALHQFHPETVLDASTIQIPCTQACLATRCKSRSSSNRYNSYNTSSLLAESLLARSINPVTLTQFPCFRSLVCFVAKASHCDLIQSNCSHWIVDNRSSHFLEDLEASVDEVTHMPHPVNRCI